MGKASLRRRLAARARFRRHGSRPRAGARPRKRSSRRQTAECRRQRFLEGLRLPSVLESYEELSRALLAFEREGSTVAPAAITALEHCVTAVGHVLQHGSFTCKNTPDMAAAVLPPEANSVWAESVWNTTGCGDDGKGSLGAGTNTLMVLGESSFTLAAAEKLKELSKAAERVTALHITMRLSGGRSFKYSYNVSLTGPAALQFAICKMACMGKPLVHQACFVHVRLGPPKQTATVEDTD